jgi:pimeloyl-ACP methyl ester carboxylesterase
MMKQSGDFWKPLAAVVLGAGVWTALAYRRDIEAQNTQLDRGSTLMYSPFGTLEYALSGSGPYLLHAHGSLGGYDHGVGLSRVLADYTVISPSRFGYLRSALPANATPEAQADAYAYLLDQLGIQKTAVLAISGGGPSAICFALRHPQRCSALILVSAVTTYDPIDMHKDTAVMLDMLQRMNAFPFWLAEKFFRRAMLAAAGLPRKAQKRMAKERPEMLAWVNSSIRFNPIERRRPGFLADLAWANVPRYEIEKLQCPLLLIHGDSDSLLPVSHATWIAEALPEAQFIRLEGGDHLAIATHADITLPAINAFLTQYAHSQEALRLSAA